MADHPLTYRMVKTRAGHVGFVVSPRGLRRIFLPMPARSHIEADIHKAHPTATADDRLMPELAAQLEQYFEGREVRFSARLDLSGHSTFDADAWWACHEIPYGETVTYKGLAERIGRPDAARAVGAAMGRNPCPIVIPCHRVLKSDGSLGGYSGPEGVGFKRRLLELEAAAHAAV